MNREELASVLWERGVSDKYGSYYAADYIHSHFIPKEEHEKIVTDFKTTINLKDAVIKELEDKLENSYPKDRYCGYLRFT